MVGLALLLLRKLLGVSFVLIGLALLVLPGPGVVFLCAGVTLLGYGPQAKLAAARAWSVFRRYSGRESPPA